MLKLTAIVSLMLIGSTLWAAGLSCDSCGAECASACGTRHFRSCCFNYLRRKRGPEGLKFWPQPRESKDSESSKLPFLVIQDLASSSLPESWVYPELKLRQIDEPDNRLQMVYDN